MTNDLSQGLVHRDIIIVDHDAVRGLELQLALEDAFGAPSVYLASPTAAAEALANGFSGLLILDPELSERIGSELADYQDRGGDVVYVSDVLARDATAALLLRPFGRAQLEAVRELVFLPSI